ncbi:hypothetical protein JW935_03435 [candidate division KSB1 bacterium]|nr:hypothetical protein [candidate division KSB1 bacterium]
MIKIRFVAVICLVCKIFTFGAENKMDMDALLERHIYARGGMQALDSIQSIRMIGRNQLYGLDWTMMPLEICLSRDGKVRIDNYWFEGTIIQYCDRTKAVWKDPNTDRFEAMCEYQEQIVREWGDWYGILLHPARYGAKTELLETESTSQGMCYHVRLTTLHFDRYIFIHTQTFLIVKEVDSRLVDGVFITMEKYYNNYQVFKGVTFAMDIETSINGNPNYHYVFCDIQVNPEFFDSLFERKTDANYQEENEN